MQIDLLKDKGILASVSFMTDNEDAELSQDELIARTLQERQNKTHSGGDDKKSSQKISPKKRHPLRLGILFIIMLIVTGYYLMEQGGLDYWKKQYRIYFLQSVDSLEEISAQEVAPDTATIADSVLSDEIFNTLMPITPDIVTLADSLVIKGLQPDTSAIALIIPDTVSTSENIQDTSKKLSEMIELSDSDINIMNNRSLLLMLNEFIRLAENSINSGEIKLNRTTVDITTEKGSFKHSDFDAILTKFTLGNSSIEKIDGTTHFSSTFEMILHPADGFTVIPLEILQMLDLLVHPFNKELQEIVVDLSRGLNDNPASISFLGSAADIRAIVLAWSDVSSNYLLKSADLKIASDQYDLTLDIVFFNYQ